MRKKSENHEDMIGSGLCCNGLSLLLRRLMAVPIETKGIGRQITCQSKGIEACTLTPVERGWRVCMVRRVGFDLEGE